ncbi:MAG: DUF1761 domain-containing protein [Flavobacteriales bacterium]|nr:DUF1761 domain-containing protein [Flavobacteriales bacterium]
MDNPIINHWAVLAAAASNLLLGALWYSPALFYRAWMKANHFTEEEVKANFTPLKTYGLTFILSLIICYNMAMFLGDAHTDLAWGATAGFLAGFGFSALIFAVIALFENRPWSYMLINGGYITLYFTLVGTIIGAWR